MPGADADASADLANGVAETLLHETAGNGRGAYGDLSPPAAQAWCDDRNQNLLAQVDGDRGLARRRDGSHSWRRRGRRRLE